jgi:KDO2-lipid IV(A) lauroyltransferase
MRYLLETLPQGGLPLKSIIAQISKAHLLFLGRLLGNLLYYLAARWRIVVRRNLQFAYTRSSPEQIQRQAKHVFQHFGISILELLQMICFSEKDVVSNLTIEDKEILIEALARKKGVVLISAHLGNYEMAWQFVPCYLGQPTTGVAKKFRNVHIDRFIHNIRTHFGNRIIYKKGALPEMVQTLRQGGIVAMLMDISRRFEGVEVNFFGRRATATPAAALLGLRCKSPIIPAFCHRDKKGRLIIQVEPPVEIQRTNDLRSDLQTNTQLITDRVERAIRNYPEQWNWMLKRWKEFYPGLYPESEKRQKQIKKKEKRRGLRNSKRRIRN